MKAPGILCLCVLTVVTVFSSEAVAKKAKVVPPAQMRPMEYPQPAANPPDIQALVPTLSSTAVAETTVLGWWQFDDAGGSPDAQGWRPNDYTAPLGPLFHVDGSGGDPACCPITPVSGQQSMWCGHCSDEGEPYCWWANLPGYGNYWVQYLESSEMACTTLTFSYTVVWDCEPGYDFVYAEYWDQNLQDYVQLPVNGGAGYYDGIGGPLQESFTFAPPNAITHVRFHFTSDGAWSDEDGLRTSNEGALKVDDIALSCPDAGGEFVFFEDFEDEACGAEQSDDGMWQARRESGFGFYGALHSGATVVQEDPCRSLISNVWGFFDDPDITNYDCGGWPFQGAMPFGPDDRGLYMNNEIWSPWVPNLGSGSEYILSYKVYRDLPVDNLQFYYSHIRFKNTASNCPFEWDRWWLGQYGDQKDWVTQEFRFSTFGTVDSIQVFLCAWDGCPHWCGIYGTGACHSHAPLFDQVKLVRVNTTGPQWRVRHIDLFQDNFPEDGTVTGYARADMAQDMLPSANPMIIPGDSIAFEVHDDYGTGLAEDPQFGGPAVYLFAKVADRWGNDLGVSGAAMESPDVTRYPGDASSAKRYPYCGSAGNASAPVGLPAGWHQFRCDTVFTASGYPYDSYCGDLMDVSPLHVTENAGNTGAFLPGHVIRYFLGAKNGAGEWNFWHRTFDADHRLYTMQGQGESEVTLDIATAYNAACEFSILPDAGRSPGEEGDILFVDDADDRGGPAQLYFDWAFYMLGADIGGSLDRVDRFDVLGPSSFVGNSLGSRVKSWQSQLIGDTDEIYQVIYWNSSDLGAGLVCDGGSANGGSGPDKSLDWTSLLYFMDFHPNNPGVYLAGDDLAEEWNTLAHPSAIGFRETYMNYILTTGDHAGAPTFLPVSPVVYQNTGMSIGPDQMVAYGGCLGINDFDVMASGGASCLINSSYQVQDGPLGAVMIQTTTNPQQTSARCVLSGFGFNFIHDDDPLVPIDRAAHLHEVCTWFQNLTLDPVGVDKIAFENSLGDAYPNPFNPTTTIKYTIKERAHVSLKIYNVAGQLVRTLVDEMQTPGEGGFSEKWNGANNAGGPVSSGVYFYRLTTGGFTQTKKMVLLK